MERVTLQVRKEAQTFPKMKPIYALLWEKDQHFYQKRLVQFITKVLTFLKNRYLKYTHLSAIVSYYSLLILFLSFNVQILRVNLAFEFIVTIIQVSPLLLFVKGLHVLHFRSIIWLCFLSLIYFVHGAMNALSGAYFAFGWGEIIFSLLLFISLAISARSYKKPKNTAQNALPTHNFFY